MSARRSRSVAIPLAITLAVLMTLAWRLARFDERIVVRITSPPGPYPMRLKGGTACTVEGVADSGDATYRVAGTVILEVVAKDEKYGKVSYGSWVGKFDPSSHIFSATITVPKNATRKEIYLGAKVIDRAARHHGSDPAAPDGSLIPIVIE
jgi:hypothetical protein